VNPSVWPDTLEYTVLESMALGKAVIVTDGGGNAEVVRRAECGLVVPPGDSRAMAEAIRMLSLDPAMAHGFGLAGRAYVQKELSEERFASRVRHLIETMLPADGPIPA
jgi:glycosyltransferase involved in cell wall biosynthesis